MRRIAVLAVFLALPAAGAVAQEIEATVGVEGLKSLPPDTKYLRLVPDRRPDGPALVEEDLRHLRGLKNLRYLDLREAGRQAGPHGVGGSRWDLHLTDAGLALIAEVSTLDVLYLPDNQEFTDAGLAILAKSLPELKNLTLRYWGAYGQKNEARLVALPAFSRLEFLDLTGCQGEHDREWPARIAAMPKLDVLGVTGCRWVRKGGLTPLIARDKLLLLHLGPVDDEDLEPIREGICPVGLSLSECPDLTGRGLAAVASSKTLKALGLHGCLRLESLAPLSGTPGLEELQVRNARALDTEGFAAIGKVPELRRLRLAGCPKLDESVLASIALLESLTHLDLSAAPFKGTPQRYSRIPVTDAGLSHLLKLEKLTVLDLSGMKFTIYGPAPEPVEIYEPCLVTDAGLQIIAGLKSLRYLRIRECPGITDEGVAALQKALPECRIER